jgi:hypothetical protein
VKLFEEMRREYEFGVGSIVGVALPLVSPVRPICTPGSVRRLLPPTGPCKTSLALPCKERCTNETNIGEFRWN